jgi:DNA-binding NtrC family response regulator
VTGAPARRGTVLVVDDEEGVRASIRAILDGHCEVLEARNGDEALEQLRRHEVDLVMLDQRMPGAAGIDVLPLVKAHDASIVVVLATAVHDVRIAVEALRRGAYDYLTKPFDVDDILLLVERALEKRALEREVVRLRSALLPTGAVPTHGFEGMMGRHPEMVRLYQLIGQIAPTPTTVLITGESGTGKELVARAIHTQSERRAQPFVAVNVAAMPDTLIESELFGHTRRARSRAPTHASLGSSSWRTAARSSSTRSARSGSTCRPSCCARSSSARSSVSAACGPSPWMRGSWRRRTSICGRPCATAPSARTCSTG